jgi:hypothetical protein
MVIQWQYAEAGKATKKHAFREECSFGKLSAATTFLGIHSKLFGNQDEEGLSCSGRV